MSDRLIVSTFIFVVALILAAGCLTWLFKQKTIVDQNGDVTEVEIPLFGKIRSNYPAAVIGFFSLVSIYFVYALWQDQNIEQVEFHGALKIPEELRDAIPAVVFGVSSTPYRPSPMIAGKLAEVHPLRC